MNVEIEKLFRKVLKKKKENKAQVWVAVAAGLGLGAVIGLLFAPESGRDLRDRLCAKYEDVEEEVDEAVEEVKNKKRAVKAKS